MLSSSRSLASHASPSSCLISTTLQSNERCGPFRVVFILAVPRPYASHAECHLCIVGALKFDMHKRRIRSFSQKIDPRTADFGELDIMPMRNGETGDLLQHARRHPLQHVFQDG